MSFRTGIITQARIGSTRLPGKVLIEVGGTPLLRYHTDRLTKLPFPLIVATTDLPCDDPIVDFCQAQQLDFFRGDEQNVLSRFYSCAKENQLDVVVRVTSDCPLIDPTLIQNGIDTYVDLADLDVYLSNSLERTFPRGMDFEIFSFALLEDAFLQATLPTDLEHVTPYINQNRSGKVKVNQIRQPMDKSQYRLTLDTPEDLKLISTLIGQYEAHHLPQAEISRLLDQHPELVKINSHVDQKKV